MPFATINGNRLYFTDHGGDGPAAVFCHGFTLDHSMWDAQVRALSPEYRCVTWDSRGHGMSTLSGVHTEWDLADDVAGLLDHLGLARAAVVGLSQGGFTAFRFGLRHADRAAALVFMDTSAVRIEDLGPFEDMADAWCGDGPVGAVAEGHAALQFGAGWPGSAAWIGKWQWRPPSAWRPAWDSILQQDTVLGRLGEITAPSLVAHGTADGAFPFPAVPQRTAQALANCHGVVGIEGAPHVSAVTHPEPVNAALAKFFRDVL